MTLVPAYGRDYKSKSEVLRDFDAGKDFLAVSFRESGVLINKEQIPLGENLTFRYKKLRSVFVHRR